MLTIVDDNKAKQPKSDDANTYYRRGLAYGKKGDYGPAIAAFTKAIDLNPDHANAYDGRGIPFTENKATFDRAIADFTKAIQLKPHDANVYYNRGNTYIQKGDYGHCHYRFYQSDRSKTG